MALKIDSRAERRNHSALLELVEAIRDCDDEGAEHHAIEWKSTRDLSTLDGQFAVARTIIGMGNRTPENASRHFGGLGYIVVGAEPGSVEGTTIWDGQVLEPLLAKYVGADGPVWHHDNVELDGKSVLVITVEAPKTGDHIHTLRKTWSSSDGKKGSSEGDIFVRRNASTHRASTPEIRSLEKRLRDGDGLPPLAVTIATEPDAARCIVLDVSDAALNAMVSYEREEVLATRLGVDMGSSLFGTSFSSSSKFDSELVQYLAEWSRHAGSVFRDAVFSLSENLRTVLVVENTGLEALEGVRVRLSMPEDIEIYFEELNPDVPSRPSPYPLPSAYTSNLLRDLGSSTHVRYGPDVELRHNRWEASYDVGVIHPQDVARSIPFALFSATSTESRTVAVTVSATNRKGTIEGTFAVRFGKEAIKPSDVGLA